MPYKARPAQTRGLVNACPYVASTEASAGLAGDACAFMPSFIKTWARLESSTHPRATVSGTHFMRPPARP